MRATDIVMTTDAGFMSLHADPMIVLRTHGPFAAAIVTIVTILSSQAAPAQPLLSPFAKSPTLAADHVPPITACPPPPAALRDLMIGSMYSPGEWNEPVPQRIATREALTRPLHSYLGQLANMANVAIQARGADQDAARICVLRWLEAWARDGALTGNVSRPDGWYERMWTVVTLGEIYLQLFPGQAMPPPPSPMVTSWLREMTSPLRELFPDSAPNKNNLFYWAGLAGIVVGTVAQDRDLYEWGRRLIDDGLSAINADGYLPLELKRGPRALSYHAYAASALMQAAAFMQANGEKPFEQRNRALVRLAKRVFAGFADPSDFVKRAGEPQEIMPRAAQVTFGWIEIYHSITKDPEAEPWLRTLRPFKTIWLGADVTAALGTRLDPGPHGKSPLMPSK